MEQGVLGKFRLSVKDFSWKQQLGDHLAFGETMSKESVAGYFVLISTRTAPGRPLGRHLETL